MRFQLYNPRSEYLRYGIREMVELAQRLSDLDPAFRFIGENIGDPVAKGWEPPAFVKDVVCEVARRNKGEAFGYTHSRGCLATRTWVADTARQFSPSSRLDAEHVLFTNGLGSAISVFYRMLGTGARILQPNPAYPAHISTERYASAGEPIGYRLDPARRWAPDLAHMESQIQKHPQVVGILLINPNNPTGAVYDAETLDGVIRLAERYHLMVISDEVYFRMVFNQSRYVHITERAQGRVPLVVMRGISKDIPWPGSRCGWMEFHNTDLDEDFNRFFESIKKPLMIEVCSTTLPQMAAPLIYNHPEYPVWLAQCNAELERNSNRMVGLLSTVPQLQVQPIQGAFYLTVLFKDGVLNERQTLPVAHAGAREFIQKTIAAGSMPLDKRFAFYLLAATGIGVVPASDFDSPWPGFRVTTLERNPERLDQTYHKLGDAIAQYLVSA